MTGPDPFMPSYASFSGARLPDLWRHLWTAPSNEAVRDYLPVPRAAPHSNVDHPPLSTDQELRLAEHIADASVGPSMLHLNRGFNVQSLYDPMAHTVVELDPQVSSALRLGADLAEIEKIWAAAARHPMPGSARAVMESMRVLGMFGPIEGSATGPAKAVVLRRSGVTFERADAQQGSLRLLCFATGDRLRLNEAATEVWNALDGAVTTGADVERSPLHQRLVSGGFIHLETRGTA